MDLASLSMGGPASVAPMGINWICLWGWLAPLKLPPEIRWSWYYRHNKRVRAVIEGEAFSSSVACGDEKFVYQNQVRRK